MLKIRRHRVFDLILAALRGFCLLISMKHAAGISAKKSDRILYAALSQDDLSNIYEPGDKKAAGK